jgi:hypothetical protein
MSPVGNVTWAYNPLLHGALLTVVGFIFRLTAFLWSAINCTKDECAVKGLCSEVVSVKGLMFRSNEYLILCVAGKLFFTQLRFSLQNQSNFIMCCKYLVPLWIAVWSTSVEHEITVKVLEWVLRFPGCLWQSGNWEMLANLTKICRTFSYIIFNDRFTQQHFLDLMLLNNWCLYWRSVMSFLWCELNVVVAMTTSDQPLDLCNFDAFCFLWSVDWIFWFL